jgi:hypothetical protein
MKLEIDIPENLAAEMKKYKNVNWNEMVNQAIEGFLHDFSILDKLKEFWGLERK